MSTTTKKRSSQRLNLESIQGKFIYLLSIVASSIGILLAINYYIIKQQHQRQQELLEVWVPTSEKFNTLSLHIEAGKLDDQTLLPLINQLNTLANRWQDQRLQINWGSAFEKIEQLKRKKAATDESLHELPEFTDLHKSLLTLISDTNARMAQFAEANSEFINYIKWLFIWEYVGYFIMGLVLSTMIALSVMGKIRKLKHHVSALTSGNLSEKIPLRNDEFYTISKSLNQLIDNLKDITIFSEEVGRGNMDASMNAFDESSELGRSLSGMRDSLKRVAHEEKNRRWINEGVAKFAHISRQHNGNVNDLSTAVIGELVSYVGALQGAIFITQKEGQNTVLRMSGCYAYDRQKFLNKQIPVDSGLIGQAYLEKLPKYLREIPKNYETITTGLGQGSPESILMMPLVHEDKVEGVLELASLRQIQEFEMEFLSKISENLGAAVAAVRISEETRQLLEESQGVTEALRSQEEEMRQNMEEMQATQEEMARAQRELTIKETNLHAFINNTTDSIITITRDYKVGLINDVLKARYKGTPFEGINTGSDILSTLGAVADEWKGYYERAFAGEHLDFSIKSSVQGEDSWREYNIHPIRSRQGEVVAASVISRDITQKIKLEQKMKLKSAVLNKVIEQASDAYIALDLNARVVIATQQLSKLLPELLAQPHEDDKMLNMVPAESKSFWKEHLRKAVAGESSLFTRPMENGLLATIKIEPIYDEEVPVGTLVFIDRQN